MIEGRNIICIASNWFYDPTSKHHVMRTLAERNHVIWVNHHGSRRPRASAADARAAMGKLRQIVQGPRRVGDNVTVVTPLVIPAPGSSAVRSLNRRLLVRQVSGVLRTLPRRPVQLWTFAPDVDYLCGQFGEECLVYYCVDDFAEFSGYDRAAILAAEARLAARADLVLVTSEALLESRRSANPRVHLMTHGVDYQHFAQATLPETPTAAELSSLPRPILGFWGLLQDWVDLDLIAAVGRARPTWSIVLIGEAATNLSSLVALRNVHCLGRRSYAELPAFAKGFDVGLIPFRVSRLTQAVNPIKLREYLAAGLPVVSTPLPEVRRYSPWVMIARDAAEFIAACEQAANWRGSAEIAAAQAAMRRETWPEKVEMISELIEETLRARNAFRPHQPVT